MEQIARRKLVLIGCMGSGKSRLARKYTEKYGGAALDTDKIFVERYGSISEFFERYGEAEFRKKEQQILIEAAASDAAIIATGGGAVTSKVGMNALRKSCDIIYLTAPIETLAARIQKSDRPLKGKLAEVLAARAPLYEKYADYIVDTSVDSLEELELALKSPRKNRYDIVLVDSDETLLDFLAAQKFALKNALDELNVKVDIDRALSHFKPIVETVWEMFNRGEITRDVLFDMRESMLGEAIGVKFAAGEFNSAYRKHLRSTKFVLYGAVDFLKELKARGIRAYVITNADTYCAEERLKPLLPYVDGAFISQSIGYSKPDRKFFEEVFKAIGEPDKNRVIVFGDSETADIKGAVNFGLDSCLYAKRISVDTSADFIATSYKNFLDIL